MKAERLARQRQEIDLDGLINDVRGFGTRRCNCSLPHSDVGKIRSGICMTMLRVWATIWARKKLLTAGPSDPCRPSAALQAKAIGGCLSSDRPTD